MPDLPVAECTGCGACIQICSQHALSYKQDHAGFLYPSVNIDLCINCKLCEKICPVNQVQKNNLIAERPFTARNSFACYCTDEKTRMESSSGGLFTVFAEKILADNGLVFGAEFDEYFSVKHGWVNTVDGLGKFRGSKYVQSRMEDMFIRCREFLIAGKKVLFTGTPCQIAGLKSFLQKEYENLFCVDVICHGVPSPLLWKKYIEFHEKKSALRIVKTAFRRKDDGWKLFSLSFTFANDSEYREVQTKGLWMCAFNKNVMMRNSCYQCVFKGDSIVSDLTIGDFWGIEHYIPEKNDDKGYSIVYINTQKGNMFFDLVRSSLCIDEIQGYDAKKYNSQVLYSIPYARNRDKFIDCVLHTDFETAYNKYVKDKIWIRLYKSSRRFAGISLRKIGLKK